MEPSEHSMGTFIERSGKVLCYGGKDIKRGKKSFLRRYATMDETWIHYYTPETKRSSAEWIAADESRPKRSKTRQRAGKVMASVFWDSHPNLFIDYLKKGKTINSNYYMALLN